MKLVRLFAVCSAAAMLPAAMAQKWEVGGARWRGLLCLEGRDARSNSPPPSLRPKFMRQHLDRPEHRRPLGRGTALQLFSRATCC